LPTGYISVDMSNTVNMDLDGDGLSRDTSGVAQAEALSNHPHDPSAEPPPALAPAPAIASIFGPSAAPTSAPASAQDHVPTVENVGDSSTNVPPVTQEQPPSHHLQDLAPTILPIYAPPSAPIYDPTPAPVSAPLPTTESTPTSAPTIEKDGYGHFSGNKADASLGEPFAHHPQAPTSVPTFGLNPLIPSDPNPRFLHNTSYDLADTDSAYDGESFLSDTTSVNSEVTQYRIEHGRRYHGYKDGAYWVRRS
jgi:hypothetical protein